jgi:APA family basic amino acid/polyamine antiporter
MGLKRTLNLFDATSIGIGAIIGAGIFVVLGIAVGYAGPAVIISMMFAGVAASFTAFSFAELSSAIPKEGAVYEFAYELVSPSVAFIVGCLWLFGNTVSGAAISLGFASYFVAMFPSTSLKIVAVSVALILTGLNLVGIKQSATLNNILVVTKIAILCLFIGAGVFQTNSSNYTPFAPNGFYGILQGAAFISFAYLGFGRIAAVGEEVKNPTRTLPLSILIALGISVIIYVLTGFVATGLQDYRVLAGSGSPLADAARATGNFAIVTAISLGALVATTSVLLTNLIGLSRISFAMARNGQLPKSVAKVDSKYGTPYVSVIVMGALMAVLTFALDLKETAAITSFSILTTYMVLNYSAIRLRKKVPNLRTFKAPMYPIIPSLGLITCFILMFSLPEESWIVVAVVIVSSSLYYLLRKHFSLDAKGTAKLRLVP